LTRKRRISKRRRSLKSITNNSNPSSIVLKPQNVYSQSRIYNEDGSVTNLNLLFEGKAFFRKLLDDRNDLSAALSTAESLIVTYLQNFPHPNIVKIYRIESNFYDQEIVLPNDDNYVNENLIPTMSKLKDFLQSIGIMYIDWKPDNTGIGEDGKFKLFDFNASGLWNLQSQAWIVKPFEGYKWRKAKENGLVNPIEIDNYCFDLGFSKDS
jgi:serine/threonine protein kinase